MSHAGDLIRVLGLGVTDPSEMFIGFALATIPSGYTSGRPTLQFDGESTVGSRTYPYLSSYTPSAGDRVLVALVNHGGCVVGKII